MTVAACAACHKTLTIVIEPQDEDEDQKMGGSSAKAESLIDDDIQLYCGCHFQWQCLLDGYFVTECPTCSTNLITFTDTGEQQMLCNLKNEGGLQEGLDILPILTEEGYLKAYPEERKCRAFLEFCGEGDIEAIVDLLEETEDDAQEGEATTGSNVDVLRYQDQIGSMGSGLHFAIRNDKFEIAWLLLFLASNLEVDSFPKEVLQAAQNFGLHRDDQSFRTDIRSLRDAEGKNAEHYASSGGEAWSEWVVSRRLKPPATGMQDR